MFDCPRSILLCFPLRVVCTANQQPRYKDKEKTKRPKEERKRGEGLGQKKQGASSVVFRVVMNKARAI
jgi:hypothetical protein